MPRLGIAPRLPLPQSGVLLLYYLGDICAQRGVPRPALTKHATAHAPWYAPQRAASVPPP
jgi:hypothetical protein